jgi:hypothetical protein
VQIYGQRVYDDPFICNVGDPNLVSVRSIPQFISPDDLNRDLSFESRSFPSSYLIILFNHYGLVDAQAAGSGNLEIIINSGRVICRVRELAPREFLAQFTPAQLIPHLIEMKFNNEHVRGSPWNVQAKNVEIAKYQNGHSTQQQLTSTLSSANEEEQYSELAGIGLHRAQVGRISFFDISASTGQLKSSDVTVQMLGNLNK